MGNAESIPHTWSCCLRSRDAGGRRPRSTELMGTDVVTFGWLLAAPDPSNQTPCGETHRQHGTTCLSIFLLFLGAGVKLESQSCSTAADCFWSPPQKKNCLDILLRLHIETGRIFISFFMTNFMPSGYPSRYISRPFLRHGHIGLVDSANRRANSTWASPLHIYFSFSLPKVCFMNLLTGTITVHIHTHKHTHTTH